MSKYKKVYAVIDNYHENRFPVIKVYYIAFPRIYRKAENE